MTYCIHAENASIMQAYGLYTSIHVHVYVHVLYQTVSIHVYTCMSMGYYMYNYELL